MNNQKAQPINISSQQVAQASSTALSFLRLETTLIPGNMRRQLDVLEVVLTGLVSGNLVVASPDQLAVELEPDKKQDSDDDGSRKTPDDDGSRKTPETDTEKGRKPAGPELPKTDASVAEAARLAGSDGSASGAE